MNLIELFCLGIIVIYLVYGIYLKTEKQTRRYLFILAIMLLILVPIELIFGSSGCAGCSSVGGKSASVGYLFLSILIFCGLYIKDKQTKWTWLEYSLMIFWTIWVVIVLAILNQMIRI